MQTRPSNALAESGCNFAGGNGNLVCRGVSQRLASASWHAKTGHLSLRTSVEVANMLWHMKGHGDRFPNDTSIPFWEQEIPEEVRTFAETSIATPIAFT
jgi:hypothetical protein